jgi:O-antigen ligase
MSKTSTHFFEIRQPASSSSAIDKYAILVILACAYATVIGPLIVFGGTGSPADIQNSEPGLPNRIFWPAMAAVSVTLVAQNYSRLSRLTWPSHIICLLAYAAFAGASVLWAFRPETSFVRFAQQSMVLSSIIFPGMLAARTTDLMRGVFLCFAVGAILNVFFVFNNTSLVDVYAGYFRGKNYLGEFSAIALLLALHETLHPGLRRVFGTIIAIIATFLLLWSNSKTAFGLAIICPLLSLVVLSVRRATQISSAVILLAIPICYMVISHVSGFNLYRVSYILYGDPTFTGRTIIWDFANYEIAHRPLFGWGYQSFWLVGTDAPSVVDAPGFVKSMPNAHNGYYDTTLELGYVGYGFLVVFILATLHAIGQVADRNRGRALFVLAIVLYVIIHNYLESLWMRGFEFLWVIFVILAVDVGRYCRPLPSTRAAYLSRRTGGATLGGNIPGE